MEKTTNNKNKIEETILLIESTIPAIAMAGIVLLVALGTILRYFFSTGILGMEETAIQLGLYSYLIGASAANFEHKEIKVNLLSEIKISKNRRWIIDVIKTLVSLAVTGFLAYVAFKYSVYTIEKKLVITPLNISKLFSVLPLLIGFTLMGLHEIYRIIILFKTKEPFGEIVTEDVELEAKGEN